MRTTRRRTRRHPAHPAGPVVVVLLPCRCCRGCAGRARVGAGAAADPPGAAPVVIVQPGDTLWWIATACTRRVRGPFDATIEEIRRLNHLDGYRVARRTAADSAAAPLISANDQRADGDERDGTTRSGSKSADQLAIPVCVGIAVYP